MRTAVGFVLSNLLIVPTAYGQFATTGMYHPIKRVAYTSTTGPIDVYVPSWSRRAYVRVWGSGGGAGGSTSGVRGGHGGAGGYVSADFKVQPGTLMFKLAIGKGGGGGARVNNIGKGGGGGSATSVLDKDFNPVMRAGAGGGGGGSSPNGQTGGAGGAAGGIAEPGLAACGAPLTDCASAGAQGQRGQTAGGAAGGRHSSCGLFLFNYTLESTGGSSSANGSTGSGGAAGTCSTHDPPSDFTTGTGRSYYDNGVNRCSAGAGGSGSPSGGAGGVEADADISCAGGGGGVNYIKPGLSLRAEVSANRETPPLPNDTDIQRNVSSKFAAGGAAVAGSPGPNGGNGLVVIYWY